MRLLAVVALVLSPYVAAPPDVRTLREAALNDNRVAAGVLRGDTLHADFTVELATWSPEGPHSLQVKVAAIAEQGRAPVIPAPLLRVRTGTVLSVTVRNALADSAIRVFGLWSHPNPGTDTVSIAPGGVRTFTFPAGAPGTYLYGARYDYQKVEGGENERETAMGAFVVDPLGPVPKDRIFVLNIWGQLMDSTTYSNALTINGRSWPLTERIEATTGDTLRWRVVNASGRTHPMHLHGFYFTLLSKGTATSDTVFAPDERFDEVTNRMRAFSTLSMEWTPTRPGNWLYHCHTAFHVVPEAAQLVPPDAQDHSSHSADAGEHMRGLVLGIVVKPKPGDVAETREHPRAIRMEVRELAPHPDKRRRMQYVLSEGAPGPNPPWRAGGPLLLLGQGQPTDITVVNHLKEATAVHWHGIELESYSDGVVGWSGADTRLAPPIAPADSFVARLSLPRPGTFIYHTHLGDLNQLGAGLYGPLVVLPRGETFDATRDHVILAGLEGPEAPPFRRVNGDSATSPPLELRVGETHRLRLIDINPGASMFFSIERDSTLARWTPLAKDGADLPASRRTESPARTRLAPGETRDMLFTPSAAGEWILRATPAAALPGWQRRIIVRP